MIAGWIVAWAAFALVVWPLSELHVIPLNAESLPGTGWPWRIDGLWAFLADLGPLLAAGFAYAAGASFYLRRLTGVAPRRWPLALLAAAVGWIPLVDNRPGLLGVSGGVAFLVMVWATRSWSVHERKPTRFSRPQLAAAALVAAALFVLSFSYGALHPFAVDSSDLTDIRLEDGRARLRINVENAGPFPARVLGIGLPSAQGLRLERLQTDSGRAEAPTLEGLFQPLGRPTLDSGAHSPVYLTVASKSCGRREASASWTLEELDIRLRTAGVERIQRVPLFQALRVTCPN